MNAALGELLRPPRLRTNSEEEERRATWFELFFDLVFVAAVAQLADGLVHAPSADAFLRFAGLFIAIAWAWMGFAFYANRFDTDDLVYRGVMSAAMLGVAALAVIVSDVMAGTGDTTAFALSYVAVRALLIALYVRARRHGTGPGRELSQFYLRGFSAGALLWLVSVFVPGPGRYLLWGAGLAIDLTLPLHGWSLLRGAPIHAAHIVERFGLFFIIVLGESIAGVVTGITDVTFGVERSSVAAFSFAIALCVWWIYFDFADTSVIGRGRMGLVFVYGHFVVWGGVALIGAGTELAITHATEPELSSSARWALAIGLAGYLLSLAVLHLAAEWTSPRDRAFLGRLVVAALALGVAALGRSLDPPVFVGFLALCLVVQLVLEAVTSPVGAASVWEPSARRREVDETA